MGVGELVIVILFHESIEYFSLLLREREGVDT
jgi:hypothetical protein